MGDKKKLSNIKGRGGYMNKKKKQKPKMQSTAITLTFWHSLQSQHQLFCHQFLAVAEDFVKSVAVEKHPTTKNTHYYEGQFTEGDSEVP